MAEGLTYRTLIEMRENQGAAVHAIRGIVALVLVHAFGDRSLAFLIYQSRWVLSGIRVRRLPPKESKVSVDAIATSAHALTYASLLTLILLAKARSSLIYARTLGLGVTRSSFLGQWYVTCLIMLARYFVPYPFNGLVHPLGELPVLFFVESAEKAQGFDSIE